MRHSLIAGFFGLLGFLLLLSPISSAEDRNFTESVVIFNTICAKCHEGECSGRLSFDGAFEKSTSHILRYYGAASGKHGLQKELFDILNYMKGKCAYYPMRGSVPVRRNWGPEILDRFNILMKRNYFIPIGRFSVGSYHMALELERDTRASIHLISEIFETAIEDCFVSENKTINIPFTIEERGDYYFRMYQREPVRIIRLSISTMEGGAKE